jgi:hypothetical protein
MLAILACTAGVASADIDTYKLSVLGDTPAGYWPMAGTSGAVEYDVSGNHRDVTGTGTGVTPNQPGPFQGARSYTFTDSGNTALRAAYFNVTDNFALEAWLRNDDAGTPNTPRVPVSNGGVGSGPGCPYGGWMQTSGQYAAGFVGAGCNGSPSGNMFAFSSTTDWHYVVVTRTSGVTRVWVDGVASPQSTTGPVGHNTVVAPEFFEIGSLEGGTQTRDFGGRYKGSISNVAFYTHALSGTSILNHWHAAQQVPTNTAVPTVSPTTVLGAGTTVRTNNGTWSGANISYAYQWQRCDAAGANCSDIPGATASAYTLTDDDTEGTVRARVIASNYGGSASASSAQTDVIAVQSPKGQAGYATAVMGDSPAGFWPMDGTSGAVEYDDSGNHRDVTGTGTGVTPNQPGPFQGAKSYTFASTGNTALRAAYYNVTDNYALEAWVRNDDAGTPNTPRVPVSNGAVSNSGCPYGGWIQTSGQYAAGYAGAGCNGATSGNMFAFSSTTDWHYVVVTRTSGVTRVWVDGVASPQSTSGPVAHNTVVASEFFEIGAVEGGTPSRDFGGQFKGSISNVAFYTHALSATAIAAHYTAARGAPTDRVRPRITPNAGILDGDTMTVDSGTWEGVPDSRQPTGFTYNYQWERCDGSTCSAIAGATATTYTAGNADIGRSLRVTVTATGPTGTGTVPTRRTAVVAPRPPVNTDAPATSGDPTDFQTLSSTTGTWTGSTPITYTRQWQRCNAAGAACANISGATGNTYTLTSADVARTVRVVVTATNAAAAVSAPSAVTAPIAGVPPANTAAPAISGTAKDTVTLSATTGTWTGSTPRTYARQWQRCDTGGGACADIAGATGATYVLTTADVGATIRVVVTATNMAGTVPATSAATATVVPAAPTATAPAAISGTAKDGETLTAADATWNGTTPITTTFQWRRCDADGSGCADIAGATAVAYTAGPDDAGHTLRVVATASNVAGTAASTSAASAVVAAIAPVSTNAPSVSGDATDGQTLSSSVGDWSGSAPIAYTRQWQRCDADGSGCADIDGATGNTYRLGTDDIGHTLRVVVTARNYGNAVTATSAASDVVAAVPVANTAVPAVSGDATDRQTLSASAGRWTGSTPITYAYQWRRCDAGGSACADVDGATSDTYRLGTDDIGATLRVAVTAHNAGGDDTATSAASAVVAAVPPSSTAAPELTGDTTDGQTLSASTGTWSGSAMTYTYVWQRCEATEPDCPADISGATSSTYRLTADDVGARIRVVVTAHNAAGAVHATSSVSDVVAAAPPHADAAPAITGDAVAGGLLWASTGTWTGTGPISFTYQWQSCDPVDMTCQDVDGPNTTQDHLRLKAASIGSKVRVVVTAHNQAGDVAAASDATDEVTS